MQLFYSDSSFSENAEIFLDENTSRHLVQVLRMKKGENIELTNGRGSIAQGQISSDNKKQVVVIPTALRNISPSKNHVTIAISLLKNSARFEWFLEKATEIGINAFIPMICERTEKQHIRVDRLQSIITSAMLQSGQAWLPSLSSPLKMEEIVRDAKQNNKFIAHCLNSTKQELRDHEKLSSSNLILIGPEGDFSPNEIEMALQKNFTPVSLGNTRLRSETAGLVAATYLA